MWFIIKVYLVVFLFMWVRWTFPRIRVDQLMNFSWKVLIPASLANILITGVGLQVYSWLGR
jgi:NADH-quinone oxidoreductase subunit H